MKRTIVILALLLSCVSALADGRHILVAVRKSTWQAASTVKKEKIKAFFGRFADPNATAIGPTRYTHTASGQDVLVACYWTKHLRRWRERIDADKIAQVKAQLADNEIKIVFTDDPQAQLAQWGLVAHEPAVTNVVVGPGPVVPR